MSALIKPTARETEIPWAQIEGWFFDLDGTLMDTDDQVVDNLARRLRLLGPDRARWLSRQFVMRSETLMNSTVTLLDFLGLDSWVFALRRRLSRKVAPTFRLIEGVKPLLQALSRRGMLAVVSTRSADDADAFLKQHHLASLFDLIVTQETTKRLKPHRAPVFYAAKTLSLPPEACVMVGDTPVDMRSARKAGAWATGVLCGFGEEAELWRAGAHKVFDTTADLLPIVEATERPAD